jgi:hypothetical protein
MFKKFKRARPWGLANPSTMLTGTENAARRSCEPSSKRSNAGKAFNES